MIVSFPRALRALFWALAAYFAMEAIHLVADLAVRIALETGYYAEQEPAAMGGPYDPFYVPDPGA